MFSYACIYNENSKGKMYVGAKFCLTINEIIWNTFITKRTNNKKQKGKKNMLDCKFETIRGRGMTGQGHF